MNAEAEEVLDPECRRRARLTRSRRAAARTMVPLLLLALAAVLANCQNPRPINFVVLGDSLSAGHQNGCTVQSYHDSYDGKDYPSQDMGYAYQIAKQARWDLKPPYIDWPGARPCMAIAQSGNLLSIDRIVPFPDYNDPVNWGTRVDPTVVTNNLSAPGTRIVDVDLAPPPPQPGEYHWQFGLDYLAMWTLFADTPDITPDKSLLDQAVDRIKASGDDRDVVIMWLGSNDALWSALGGTHLAVTDTATFQAAYDAALGTLRANMDERGLLIVPNLPDLTVTPHFIPALDAIALFGYTSLDQECDSSGLPVGTVLGLNSGDRVIMFSGLPAMYQILVVDNCTSGPLTASEVLTPTETANLQAQIAAYNAVIENAAAANGAVVVDVAGLLADADQHGYDVGGETLTTEYFGGIFSLDGVHPNNTGYAVVANEFIRAMNAAFDWRIPEVDEAAVRAAEPPHNRGLGAPF